MIELEGFFPGHPQRCAKMWQFSKPLGRGVCSVNLGFFGEGIKMVDTLQVRES